MNGEQKTYWSDEISVLAAVKENGLNLEHASDDLKGEKEVVLAAVTQNGLALEYASDDLKDEKDVIKTAAIKAGWIDDSDTFDTARDILIAAVTKDGRALRYASPNMKKDYDVVLAAVTQNGLALEYASNVTRSWMSGWNPRNVKDVIMAAVRQNGLALEFTYYQDKQIVQEALRQNFDAWGFVSEWFRQQFLKENKVAPEDVEDSEEDALFFKLRF